MFADAGLLKGAATGGYHLRPTRTIACRSSRANFMRPSLAFVQMIPQRYQRSLNQILAHRRRHFNLQRSRRYNERCSRTSEIMKTVADQFAEALASAGVKRIYGIVGDSLNGLTDAIRRQGKIRSEER